MTTDRSILYCRHTLVFQGNDYIITDGPMYGLALDMREAGVATIRWHEPCAADDLGAREDHNRMLDRMLDRGLARYKAPPRQ